MAIHSGILAYKISWTEELGTLPSIGSQSQTGPNTYTRMTKDRKKKGLVMDSWGRLVYSLFIYYYYFLPVKYLWAKSELIWLESSWD